MMKKVLMFAGAAFGLLIVTVIIVVAMAANNGKALDRESKQYSDSAIRAICSNWDESQLIDRASPEMLKALPTAAATQRLFAQWRMLGPMMSLEPLHGDSNTTVMFGSGVRITAGYVGVAHFKGGAAQVRITLIKHDGAWRMLGFWVYGNLDPTAPAPSAQVAYHPI